MQAWILKILDQRKPAGMTSAGFLCSMLLLPLIRETIDALWATESYPK
ncbi:hypothetical protein [Xanthomonas arboricola]|nr:hypothetical protein [Xanthomonas arboricola]CAD7382944.1 hypothetical protein X12_002754 [Xanthomonas arboricola]CAG2092588.1 hypothetical protein XCY_002757 [Xanthomonas arboricola pv. juglandis]